MSASSSYRSLLRSSLTVGFVGLSVLAASACGDDDTGTTPPTTTPGVNNNPSTCAQTPPPQKVSGGTCEASIELPPLVSVTHVPEGSVITYCSNPPSSGPHYPIWAAFQEYTKPIDTPQLAPYLVHSLEHGAVALLYKCDGACTDVVDALKKIRDELTADPLCSGDVKVRIIIAPSTAITTKVAATAWGATYQAPCVDATSLAAFVKDHYAKGPEDLCVAGRAL